MARSKPVDRSPRFLPVILSEQIQSGNFEFALDYLIDHELDLSALDARFRNDETGASAYDPRVMLKIVLLAKVSTQWQLYCPAHNTEKSEQWGTDETEQLRRRIRSPEGASPSLSGLSEWRISQHKDAREANTVKFHIDRQAPFAWIANWVIARLR